MKKILLIMLAVSMILVCVSCGTDTTSTSDSSSANTAKEASVDLSETISLKDLKFTATKIIRNNDTAIITPATDGMIVVAVKFSLENISSTEQNVAGLMLFDSYADDTKVLLSTAGMVHYTPMLNGTLAAGKKMEGYHVVEVPTDAKQLTLEFSALYESNDKFNFDIP